MPFKTRDNMKEIIDIIEDNPPICDRLIKFIEKGNRVIFMLIKTTKSISTKQR